MDPLTYIRMALDSGLPPVRRLVLVAVANAANKRGVARVSHAALAHTTGLSTKSVGRHLRALQADGIVIAFEAAPFEIAPLWIVSSRLIAWRYGRPRGDTESCGDTPRPGDIESHEQAAK